MTKSSKLERMKTNSDLYGWEIPEAEMNELDALDQGIEGAICPHNWPLEHPLESLQSAFGTVIRVDGRRVQSSDTHIWSCRSQVFTMLTLLGLYLCMNGGGPHILRKIKRLLCKDLRLAEHLISSQISTSFKKPSISSKSRCLSVN